MPKSRVPSHERCVFILIDVNDVAVPTVIALRRGVQRFKAQCLANLVATVLVAREVRVRDRDERNRQPQARREHEGTRSDRWDERGFDGEGAEDHLDDREHPLNERRG
jgi:hypothetical protein